MTRGPASRRTACAGAAAAAVLALAGCTDQAADPAPSAPATSSLEDLDLASLSVARAPFCDRIPEPALTAALGGEMSGAAEHATGERIAITRKTRDVIHEYSCTFTGGDGAVAEAWVFVPPITTARARDLAGASLPGCRSRTSAPAFGSPSAGWTCARDGERSERLAGLIGDAWLTCQLTAPDGEGLAARADLWCAAVAVAAAS